MNAIESLFMGLIQSTRWVTPLELALTEARLTALLKSFQAQITQIQQKEATMDATLDDILTETARQTSIEQSTQTFIEGLEARITAAGGDQTKINAIFAALKGNNDAAAALVANTPAAA